MKKMKAIKRKIKFEVENTLGDKIKVIVQVKEKGGNITFITVSNKIKETLKSFTDVSKIKQTKLKEVKK